MGRLDAESETLIPQIGGYFDVAHSLRGDGFDASEDGTGHGTPLVPVAHVDVLPTMRAASGGAAHNQRSGDTRDDYVVPVHCRKVAAALTSNYGKQPDSSDTAFGPNLIAFDPPAGGKQTRRGAFSEATGTLEAAQAKGNRGQGVLAASAVRRLTPRECERLQGFPEIKNSVIIKVCSGVKSPENAHAEIPCTTAPHNAWRADESVFPQSVKIVKSDLSANHPNKEPHVVVRVQIDLERSEVKALNAGKLIWSASIAAKSGESRLHMPLENFVHLAVLLMESAAQQMQDGRGASPPRTTLSIHRENGNLCVTLSGDEIKESAAAAVFATKILHQFIRSTTLQSGQSSQICELPIRTLCCSVASVIASSIPNVIHPGISFAVALDVVGGFTNIPWRGKPTAPDGPRYKALGNSMAVPCMRWIGERIDMVNKLP